MTAPAPADLLHKVWEYPLFEALYGRRSRRFGLGFEMAEGPFKYKSGRAPVPLSDIEEALLVAAGVGFSGIALWDQSRPLPYRAGDGRTFPSTSRGRRTALFFTNDQGVYVIDPAAPSTSNVMPLSHLERQACYFMFSEPAAICQNMFLTTEALGLGGWMHCGFLSRDVFKALGFTTVIPPETPILANPVGLDGVFQAYCPPYFPNMDAAVDAVLTPLSPSSLGSAKPAQSGPVPYLMSDAEHRNGTFEISDDGIACTKAICNYIYETYGRFPGGLDAMHLMWFLQAHHLDTEYYDRFFRSGAYGPTHAAHLATWHP